MQAVRPAAPQDKRRRWRTLGAAGAAAVLAHVALFDALEAPWRPGAGAAPMLPAPALEVRAVAPTAAALTPTVSPPESAPALAPSPPRPPPPPRLAASMRAAVAKAPAPGSAAVTPPKAPAGPAHRDAAPVRPATRSASPAAAAALVAAASSPDERSRAVGVSPSPSPAPEASTDPSDDPPVPVYAAQPPPPATLRYRLERGASVGMAELRWQAADAGYVVRLEAMLAGRALLTQTSRGELDAGGLVPLRFTDRRGRREEAANFQRDAGKLTFSGPKAELPMWRGGQDALSWMLQLAAVVAADPALRTPGARVALHVVGARADEAVWLFHGSGPQLVDTGGGPIAADRFVREPRGAYDLRAEIWLDPLRHHLPVRIALTGAGDAGPLDFVLESMTMP